MNILLIIIGIVCILYCLLLFVLGGYGNNFHIFRATHLAESAGYAEVYGLAARSHIGYLPNNMLREFFGIMKDFLVGNLN